MSFHSDKKYSQEYFLGGLDSEQGKDENGGAHLTKQIIPVWKTIKLGTGLKSGQEFCVALEKQGFFISEWARELLIQPYFTSTIASVETEVKLVKPSVEQLGFKSGARLADIYDQVGQAHGLQLCSPEVGPQLRRQYTDQPLFSRNLRIAMMPMLHANGKPLLFQLSHFNVSCLYTSSGSPKEFFRPDSLFTFVRP